MGNECLLPTVPVTKPVCYSGSRFNARFPNTTFIMVQWYDTMHISCHTTYSKSMRYPNGLNAFTRGGYKFLSITNFI